MQKPLTINRSQINKVNLESIISGKNSAIVIQNFYDAKDCKKLAHRIKNKMPEDFQNGKLSHIGPFLMSHTTTKEKYFQRARNAQEAFNEIFSGVKRPEVEIHEYISQMLPSYSVSSARESQNQYSPFIIRIHEKGKEIPIHKDNVKHEGREYNLSEIDCQLSCVLHLQESENGGDLIIYDRQWKKEDEKFRNIDFGYTRDAISDSIHSRLTNIHPGDLVIINPRYYHKVTKITGDTPRITLGMFLGIYRKRHKIVAWA